MEHGSLKSRGWTLRRHHTEQILDALGNGVKFDAGIPATWHTEKAAFVCPNGHLEVRPMEETECGQCGKWSIPVEPSKAVATARDVKLSM